MKIAQLGKTRTQRALAAARARTDSTLRTLLFYFKRVGKRQIGAASGAGQHRTAAARAHAFGGHGEDAVDEIFCRFRELRLGRRVEIELQRRRTLRQREFDEGAAQLRRFERVARPGEHGVVAQREPVEQPVRGAARDAARRRKPFAFEHRADALGIMVGGVGVNPLGVLQLRERRGARECTLRARHEHRVEREQRLDRFRILLGGIGRKRCEREIERAVAQLLAQLVEAQLAKLDGHERPVTPKVGEGVGETRRARDRRHADHQPPFALALQMREIFLGALQLAQHRARAPQQRLAFGGRHHAPGIALEQAHAALVLQIAHGLGDGGLRHVQPPRRAVDGARGGDLDQRSQLVDFHDAVDITIGYRHADFCFFISTDRP
ncbi:hypothetical protein PT2222_260042 [Paraburkholderia tropica]